MEIAVHDDDRPTSCVIDTGGDGSLVSKVAAQVNGRHVAILVHQLVDEPGRAIPAAVIDQKDLVRHAQRLQDIAEPAVQFCHVLLLVKKRNDDGDHGGRLGRLNFNTHGAT